jgi:hypothetical protein
MARVVTYAHRYKRPPKKRKSPAVDVPTVVTTKKSRRSVPGFAAAESVPRSPPATTGQRNQAQRAAP